KIRFVQSVSHRLTPPQLVLLLPSPRFLRREDGGVDNLVFFEVLYFLSCSLACEELTDQLFHRKKPVHLQSEHKPSLSQKHLGEQLDMHFPPRCLPDSQQIHLS